MVDAEALILDELGRLAPLGSDERADWNDVLRRANVRTLRASMTKRPRRLALALAVAALMIAAIAVSPLGAAIGREVGNFSDWLTGHPGTPASSSAERAFSRQTRSWFDFPKHTALRRLISSTSDGLTVTVFGFRSSDALCLRLVTSGAATQRDLACAPLRELRARKQPALVLTSDYGVGAGGKATDGPLTVPLPKATITAGIVADGVTQVVVGRNDGTRSQAIVDGDAFLSISTHPAPELRVNHIWASAQGKLSAVPFFPAITPLGLFAGGAPPEKATGPSVVERPLHTGAISWFARRQPRGASVPQRLRRIGILGASSTVIFARMITPDPQAAERLIISLLPAGHRYFNGRLHNNNQVCAEVVGGVFAGGRIAGGGCWPAGRLFSTGPFTQEVTSGPNNQYVTIAGVASDDVARIRLYLTSGAFVPIALRDNGYVVQASAADYPLRLVGYDSQGRTIGIITLRGNRPMILRAGPVPGAQWTTVLSNRVGTIMTAPSTNGGLCVGFRYGNAASINCAKPPGAKAMQLSGFGGKGGIVLVGPTGSAITRVVANLRDGSTVTLVPQHGYILKQLVGRGLVAVETLSGLTAQGKTVAVERWRR